MPFGHPDPPGGNCPAQLMRCIESAWGLHREGQPACSCMHEPTRNVAVEEAVGWEHASWGQGQQNRKWTALAAIQQAGSQRACDLPTLEGMGGKTLPTTQET